MVACPTCDETGCEACDHQGYFYLRQCPKQQIDSELYGMTRLASFLEKGIPPIAGGSLEQSAWFMDFAATLQLEMKLAEAEIWRK